MEIKLAPSDYHYSETITLATSQDSSQTDFAGVFEGAREDWYFNNCSESINAGELLSIYEIKDGYRITLVLDDGSIESLSAQNVTYNGTHWVLDVSSITNEVPVRAFITDTLLQFGDQDEIITNKICDFSASDNQTFQITCTWSTPLSLPDATFNLRNVTTGDVYTNVTSPYVIDYSNQTSDGTFTFEVDAVSTEGTITSNQDQGSFIANTPPSSITDFSAADGCGSVTVTFTPATGLPTPTHDLYENDALVASDISSGYVRSVGAGNRTYYVKAVNVAGSTNSNTDSGESGSSPSTITNFTCSDVAPPGPITLSWTNSTGTPTPTQDLWVRFPSGTEQLVASGVTSPYTTTTDGYYTWWVEASNRCGTITSNTCVPEPSCTPGSDSLWTPGTIQWTSPTGCTSISATVQGGGGSGSLAHDVDSATYAGGGYAGLSNQGTTGPGTYNITCGSGGAGVYCGGSPCNGNTGTTSWFGSIGGTGGSGGVNGGGYNAGGHALCAGSTYSYFGQSSAYGQGGIAVCGGQYGGNGGTGAGGSGYPTSTTYFTQSGAGGSGFVEWSWGTYERKPWETSRNIGYLTKEELESNYMVYPNIQDRDLAYELFHRKSMEAQALWELQGNVPNFNNSNDVERFRQEIQAIKDEYKDKLNDLANKVNDLSEIERLESLQSHEDAD